MAELLSQLLASMDSVVFLRLDDNNFKLVTKAPQWLPHVLVAAEDDDAVIDLTGKMAFLDYFLEDATLHWQQKSDSPLTSDEWIEVGRQKQEFALVAVAQTIEDAAILTIQCITGKYWEKQAVYQQARESLLTRDMLEKEVHQRTQLIREREEEIFMRLLGAAGKRDQETGAHVRRIGLMCAALAEELGWKQSDIDDLRIAAPMHDIGKIGIPDSILLKPGNLDDAEFSIMQRHAQIGADMLAGTDIPMMEMARQIALCHHERWDGTGYPNGLRSTDIPECARITTVADVYDALSHKRVYKHAFSEEETLSMMREQSGKHFDPVVFEAFLNILASVIAIKTEFQEIEEDIIDFTRLTGTNR